jgi:hypothetical protein
MAVALKVNGVACRDIDSRNGVSKLSIETYPGGATTSPAPIIYYTYEDHDTAIEDYSENGTDHDGVGSGTSRSATRKRGDYSCNAPATDDYVEVAHHSELNFNYNSEWTMATWVYTGASQYRGIYVKREGGTGYKGVAIYLNAGNLEGYVVSVYGTGGTAIHKVTAYDAGDLLNQSVWHQIVVTFDGSGNASGLLAYVDGDALGSDFAVAGGKSTVGTNSIQTTEVARWGGASDNYSQGITGLLDESILWDKALTPNQVTVLYNGGSPADTSRGL